MEISIKNQNQSQQERKLMGRKHTNWIHRGEMIFKDRLVFRESQKNEPRGRR